MKEYTLSNKKKTFNSNCYINLTYVKSFEQLKNVASNELISTNINDIKQFCCDLGVFESETANGKRKDSSTNYGILLTFLLENEQNKEDLKALTNEIVEKYNNLPYMAYETQRGKGNYLVIYLCERFYYPMGKVIEKVAEQDSYKDSITGKVCKKDSKNAVVWHKKGDIISTKIQKFTSKTRIFRYANQSQFKAFIIELKKFFIDLCARLLKTVKSVGITFKKYVKCILSKNQKGVAKLWNDTLKALEEIFDKNMNIINNVYDQREQEYINAKKDLDNLFIKYNNLMHQNKQFYDDKTKFYIPVKYKKVKFNIDFNESYKSQKQNTQLLIDKFTTDLDTVMSANLSH